MMTTSASQRLHVLVRSLLCGSGIICLALASQTAAAVDDWLWVTGSELTNRPGHYGTKGVAAPDNTPGARRDATSWGGSDDALWLFGGLGYARAGSGLLNDLWRYDAAAGTWTWIAGSDSANEHGLYGDRGVASPLNVPGARSGAASWRDVAGRLWLFGGHGYDGNGTPGYLNDLWQYDPATAMWTWIGGGSSANTLGLYGTQGVPSANNAPGGRTEATAWTDGAGNLWLFGGSGFGEQAVAGRLNDLWRYDPGSSQWIWVRGAKAINTLGLYGTRGVSAPFADPGSRAGAGSWTDAFGAFWLFGGFGLATTSTAGHLNDLWRFDPSTGTWTWMSGASVTNSAGSYGNLSIPSAANVPGARHLGASWQEVDGTFWLFGGAGCASTCSGELNDVWRYEPAVDLWTWMGGSSVLNEPGAYGAPGIREPGSRPGSRDGAAGWSRAEGGFWLFGGHGIVADGAIGLLNDLWMMTSGAIDPAVSVSIAGASTVEGNAGTTNAVFAVSLSAPSPLTVQVSYATANATAAAGSDYDAASGVLTFAPGVTSQTIAVTVIGDLTFEADETFSVQLSNPINAALGADVATGTILNDDPEPRISIDDVSIPEGNSGSVAAQFSVTLSNPSSQPVLVSYKTADGSAAAGSDYAAASGRLKFEPGATRHLVAVSGFGDRLFEADETFAVVLGSPSGATIARSKGVGALINDDQKVGETEVPLSDPVVQVGATLEYVLTWTHPVTWRTLDTIDLRVRDDHQTILSIRFTEGEDTLRLYDPHTDRYSQAAAPGSPTTLDTAWAVLHLADSAVVGTGPTGPSVTLTYGLSFKPPAAGRTYVVEVFAEDDLGSQQGWDTLGTLRVDRAK
jgi:N-acetylneuraminic acid mutarotase